MYTAIVIDDEKNSSELLEWQITKYCPSLKIVAVCQSPKTGIEAIQKFKPDLVFLDIEMPQMTGFEMLEQLNPISFDVIFTTAYDEFAIQAFKVSALDYLLKPIDINELKTAVAKFEAKHNRSPKPEAVVSPASGVKVSKDIRKRIALTTTDSLLFVDPENIIYCESSSNYTYFHLASEEKKVLVAKTLKDIEEILVNYDFFRIHNSYLVNMKHIREFVRGAGGHVVMSNGNHLTVSRTRKDEFFEMFSRF